MISLKMIFTIVFFFSNSILSIVNSADLSLASLVYNDLEFCETDTFKAECPEHHVVMITKAMYGRMSKGKCLKSASGCGLDVLLFMENLCSGRRSCEFVVPNKELENRANCEMDMKTYLKISFQCLQVEHDACLACAKKEEIEAVVGYEVGYLASITTSNSEYERKCGSATCPWKIEVMSGQTINLTLYDFSLEKTKQSSSFCFRYAVLKDKPQGQDKAVCGGKARIQHIHLSTSNSLEILVVNPKVFNSYSQFLIKYEAVGCPDYEPPLNSRVRRIKDMVEVSCEDGFQWQLKCVGTKWVGETRVCPSAITSGGAHFIGPLSVGLLTAIVIGIALVIAVLIVTVGVVCLKKHQRENLRNHGALYIHPSQCYELRGHYHRSNYLDETESLSRKYQKSLPQGYNFHSPALVGKRNVYDVPKSIETRPLPSIPVESTPSSKKKQVEAQLDTNSHKYQSVIVSTSSAPIYQPPIFSNSNASQSHIPMVPCSIGQKPIASSTHYTVLDPGNSQNQKSIPSSSAAYSEVGTLTWVVPDGQSAMYGYASSSQGGSDDGASSRSSGPQVSNKNNLRNMMAIGEVNSEQNNSEIPLRPMREGSQNTMANQTSEAQNSEICNSEAEPKQSSLSTGNSSWP